MKTKKFIKPNLKQNILFLIMCSVALLHPPITHQANLTNASATLSNSRFSSQDAQGQYVVQTGSLTVKFTNVLSVPAQGQIILTIPAPDSGGNDGVPDVSDTPLTNGFDLNTMQTSNITCSDDSNSTRTWTTTEINVGTSTKNHTILCEPSSTVTPNTAITIAINSSPGLVNPLKTNLNQTEGLGDTYELNIQTTDAAGNILDGMHVNVAPIEAVTVSATVVESLSFRVEGVAENTVACNQTMDIATTSDTVAFGSITARDKFKDGAQLLTVSTNVFDGYIVQFYEDHSLKQVIQEQATIPDTTCDGKKCNHIISGEWEQPTAYGFGYSLENIDGADAEFTYDEKIRNFSSKSVPNIEKIPQAPSDTNAHLLAHGGPVAKSSVYVCYRLAVSGSQASGFYSNTIRYTASANF